MAIEDLSGKVAVVTGAASGIGLAMSRRFTSLGMRVVMADVEANALRVAAEGVGGEALAVRTDVAQADQVAALAEAAREAFGSIHVVCNNAGVFAGGTSWEAPLSDYEWVLGVNMWGVVHGVRTFLPILLEQGEPAHVVITASMAGLTSAPLSAAYYMSKHAVVALAETLYLELEAKGAPVGVSVVCPELISTGIGRSERNRPPHLKRASDDEAPGQLAVEAALREMVPTGRDPDVIAERTVEAIQKGRFYVLSEPGGVWRKAMEARFGAIRSGSNPTLPDIGGGN